jgi:hypothetical protein
MSRGAPVRHGRPSQRSFQRAAQRPTHTLPKPVPNRGTIAASVTCRWKLRRTLGRFKEGGWVAAPRKLASNLIHP